MGATISNSPLQTVGGGGSSTRGSSVDRRRRGRSASPRPPSPHEMMWEGVSTNTPIQSMNHDNNHCDDRSNKKPPRYIAGDHDDTSVLSDDLQSQAKTVATDALGAILERIDRAKADMVTGVENGDLSQQMEMAKLIETLASAASAVKKLEDFQ